VIAGFDGHLLPEDYLERLIDEPARLAAGTELQRGLKTWLAANQFAGPASGLRALVDAGALPLVELLGLVPTSHIVIHDGHAIVLCHAAGRGVPLLVTSWGASLNRFWREAVIEGVRHRSTWALLFNGTHLRVVRPARLHSRRHLDLQLDAAADDARTAATLAFVFRNSSLGGEAGNREALVTAVVDAERHAAGVCRSLKTGVLDASTHLLRALFARDPSRPVDDVFEQSLTIVYRLLFLFFAEARALVPLWHPIYRDSYSVESLRNAAMVCDRAGLWDGLRAVARLAHAGVQIGGLKITAFNGRLFAPARTPLAERRGLDDRAAGEAIVAVSTRPSRDGEGRERISYRDLGVEQLGAVYETLLDYTPRVETPARGRGLHVTLRPGSGVRKSTGTFYTPQPLVDYLVRDALFPLVRDATPEQILERRVLDPSMGSGAFLVGACRYLGDAYEAALVAHGRCLASDIGPRERASIRRLVAERCLFGVDINPTAVQLARLSLWLTTLAADRPLTFLDHHLRVGDSLAGAWLSVLKTAPTRKRAAGPLPLFPESFATDVVRAVLPVRFRLALDPNDTAAQVRAKERALTALSAPGSPLEKWTCVADAWCSAWLADPAVPAAAFAALSDALLGQRGGLAEPTERALLERVRATSAARRLFHWELEFPEVFFGPDGVRRPDAGFDAVVGNPPWDMVRADTQGDRSQIRREATALVRFARDSGVYETRTDGHVNRYQLFVERAMALARPGGRIGLVLPSGMMADSGSAPLRRTLFSRCVVERVVGFDNRSGTFPVHRSVKFILLSARSGGPTGEIACRFGETNPVALEHAADADGRPEAAWFTTRLTPALLAHLSGEDLSVPDLRSPLDLAIAERAASLFAPVGSRDGWNAHFGRELNATEDRQWLVDDGRGVPVLEGKLIEPFRTDPGRARWHISAANADRLLGPRWRRTRLAYRDVSSPSNRLTLIAAMLGAGTVSTHTLFCLKEPLPVPRQQLLVACFNSLVVNFLVRLRVNTHVTTGIVERLPFPREDQMGPEAGELARICGVLARAHEAREYVRLNALVAHMYRLTEMEFAHVLSTFPLIDGSEREAMLHEFLS
jgi:Eco57I restriction-modification methylase